MCTFAIASGENPGADHELRKKYEPGIHDHARRECANHGLFGLRITSTREVLMVYEAGSWCSCCPEGLAQARLPHGQGSKKEKDSNAKK